PYSPMPDSSPPIDCFENVNQLTRRSQITTQHSRIAHSVAAGDKEIGKTLSLGVIDVEPRDIYTVEKGFSITTTHIITNLTEYPLKVRVTSPSSLFSYSLPDGGTIQKRASLTLTIQQKDHIKSKVKIYLHIISSNALLSPYVHSLTFYPPSAIIHSLQSLLPFKPSSSLPSIIPLLTPLSSPPPDSSSINNAHLGVLLLALQ
ncbi:hypothetical protein PFISCL1PPCAC_15209, partial [Pristionchus fissidentatus]